MERRRHHLRDERGTTLIEVIVAAVVLVVISGAITSMLNGATISSGQQRLQAIGADLGQATLEEWRTKPFSQLQNLDITDPSVSAGGHTFEVHTESAWAMENQPGAQACSAGGHSPEALRLSTRVTWKGMRRKPIILDTLVAAPAGSSAHRGTFVEQITDRDGYGVDAVTVTLAGGPSGSTTGVTDSNGCVRFSDIMEGRYTLSFSKGGYVTPRGLAAVSEEVDVMAGQSRSRSDEFDRAGTARIRFVRGDTRAALNAATDDVFGAQFTSPLLSRGLNGAADGSTFTYSQADLYPNTGEYAVYPDTCSAGRPSTDGVSVPQGAQSPVTDVAVPVMRVLVDDSPNTGLGTQPKDFQLRVMSACGTRYQQTTWTPRGNNANGTDVQLPYLVVPGGTETKVCVVYRYTETVAGVNRVRYGTKRATYDVASNTESKTLTSGGWTIGLTTEPTTCPA